MIVDDVRATVSGDSRFVTLAVGEGGAFVVEASWSGDHAIEGRDAWLRWGEGGGEFVPRLDDLSRSRRSGVVRWEVLAIPGSVFTGKIRGRRFRVDLTVAE